MPLNRRPDAKSTQKSLDKLKKVSYAAIALSIIAIIISLSVFFTLTYKPYKVDFGNTTAGINTPLNSSSLAVINNAPNSYFERAGEMYLNGTLSDPVFPNPKTIAPFSFNSKATVLYLGSITCVFCAENRWAMALALSRFGKFSGLYVGYSALGDSDVPTIYWTPEIYNSSSDSIGNYYSSNIINFLSIEDTHPITGGFALNSMPQMLSNLNAKGNSTYVDAFKYILNLSRNSTTAFQGTPYTVWGNYLFTGADAEVFGNTTPTGSALPITYMSHAQILSQLANPTDQFAMGQYAAADVYAAAICKSINNTASVCSLPAITAIESALK